MLQPCNMSYFEKDENYGMAYGVKKSNLVFTSEIQAKSLVVEIIAD